MEAWQELQTRVCQIFNRQSGFRAEENKPLIGARSTVKVDVYIRHEYGPLDFTIVVECKSWNSRIPQEKAFALKSVVEDVGASMGIIISELGIQPGCERFIGAHTNLRAFRIDELEERMTNALEPNAGIEQLELLLDGATTTELDLIRCFEAHPQLLLNLGYEAIIVGPTLRDESRTLRPDFILRPPFGQFCDLLEIKHPATRLLLGHLDRPKVIRAAVEAVAQLHVYHEFFADRVNASVFYEQYGVLCYRPQLLLIAGRSPNTFEELLSLRDIEMSSGIRLITYDQLLAAARVRMFRSFS